MQIVIFTSLPQQSLIVTIDRHHVFQKAGEVTTDNVDVLAPENLLKNGERATKFNVSNMIQMQRKH
jgi:hypothetical protein